MGLEKKHQKFGYDNNDAYHRIENLSVDKDGQIRCGVKIYASYQACVDNEQAIDSISLRVADSDAVTTLIKEAYKGIKKLSSYDGAKDK